MNAPVFIRPRSSGIFILLFHDVTSSQPSKSIDTDKSWSMSKPIERKKRIDSFEPPPAALIVHLFPFCTKAERFLSGTTILGEQKCDTRIVPSSCFSVHELAVRSLVYSVGLVLTDRVA